MSERPTPAGARTPLAIRTLRWALPLTAIGMGFAAVAWLGAPKVAGAASAAILCYVLASAVGAFATGWLASPEPAVQTRGFFVLYAAACACVFSVPVLVFMASMASPPIPMTSTLAVPLAGICLGWASGSGTLWALRVWRRPAGDDPDD